MIRFAFRLPPSASRSGGFTVVEVAVVAAMIAILTAMVVPVARYTLKRQNEIELRYDLRLMRDAIDKYKQYSDSGLIPPHIGAEGYPAELKTLVEGVTLVGSWTRSSGSFGGSRSIP